MRTQRSVASALGSRVYGTDPDRRGEGGARLKGAAGAGAGPVLKGPWAGRWDQDGGPRSRAGGGGETREIENIVRPRESRSMETLKGRGRDAG